MVFFFLSPANLFEFIVYITALINSVVLLKTIATHSNSSHKMELDEAIVCSDNEGLRRVDIKTHTNPPNT